MSNRPYLTLVFMVLVFVVGCAGLSGPTLPSQFPPPAVDFGSVQFEYTPVRETNSLKATLGVVAPTFKVDIQDETYQPFDFTSIQNLMSAALTSDFNATLMAKGYSTLGPYSSLDDMVFGEKQTVNLVIVPQFILTVHSKPTGGMQAFSRVVDHEIASQSGSATYVDHDFYVRPGTLSVNGFIELTMIEPLSNQKIWTKKINISRPDVKYDLYVLEYHYYTQDLADSLLGVKTTVDKSDSIPAEYDGRVTAVVQVLQEAYRPMLDEFAKYFDPQEISHAIEDAKEARKRARF